MVHEIITILSHVLAIANWSTKCKRERQHKRFGIKGVDDPEQSASSSHSTERNAGNKRTSMQHRKQKHLGTRTSHRDKDRHTQRADTV